MSLFLSWATASYKTPFPLPATCHAALWSSKKVPLDFTKTAWCLQDSDSEAGETSEGIPVLLPSWPSASNLTYPTLVFLSVKWHNKQYLYLIGLWRLQNKLHFEDWAPGTANILPGILGRSSNALSQFLHVIGGCYFHIFISQKYYCVWKCESYRANISREEIPDGSNVSGEPLADVSEFSLFSPNSFLYIDSIYEIL